MVSSLRDELDIIGIPDFSSLKGTIPADSTGFVDFQLETDETAIITGITTNSEKKGVLILYVGSRGNPTAKTIYEMEFKVGEWSIHYDRLIFLDRTKTLRISIKNNDTTLTSKFSINVTYTIFKTRVLEMLQKNLIEKYKIDLTKG